MKTTLDYYHVRYVNLINGRFFECEMSETQLAFVTLASKLGNAIQVIGKVKIKTIDLISQEEVKRFV